MKNLSFFFILMLPLTVIGQHIIANANEPVALYHEINKSLTLSEPKAALQTFAKVVDFYVDQGREKELPASYFGMALALAINGHYKKSIRYHKKAIRVHKKYKTDDPFEMYINLALTYELAGKMRKSKQVMEEI